MINRLPPLLFVVLASGAQAEGLGRLFFTPEQRAQFERVQMQRAATQDSHATTLMLNGIVQRSDGARTVWLNGMAEKADSGSAQVPTAHRIAVRGKLQPGEIKVGERLSLEQDAAK